MRKFLLVGCGGSGGATLQFLMDQLRADLGLRGIHALPQGWQFVHIDVPIAPDGVGPTMPPTVKAQGGRYVGLAHPGANYPGVAQAVEAPLGHPGELRQLVTWRADPAAVGIPIADGAGQQRAIGRMLTLAKSGTILEHLNASFAALHNHGVNGELARIADEVSPATSGQVSGPPVVLVVSSMAGGAGAAMVLDVCRLLTQVDGYDPRATALFLFTPEVFGSLPQHACGGVHGNALAMAGELIAAQAGSAAPGDTAILAALGIAVHGQASVPFGRVVPVGAKIGASGAPFGDGSVLGVYRGLGRGLAALMMSGQATHEFIAYDIVNSVVVPTKQDTLGWGLDTNALLWGSFGFASLGLGRERYAEYAAQRLARAAVDRLVEGHLYDGDPRSGSDQLRARNDAAWSHCLQCIGLPSGDIRTWFMDLLRAATLEPVAVSIVDDVLGRHLQLGQPTDFKQWLAVLRSQVARDTTSLNARIEHAAYVWAFDWHRELRDRLEDEVARRIVDAGLAAARDMIMRIVDAADTWVHLLKTEATTPVDVTVLPADVQRQLGAVKGTIDSGHAALQLLRDGFGGNVRKEVGRRCAVNAAAVLGAIRTDLLRPLATACDEALRLLTSARTAHPADTGLARLRTDDYASWPDASQQLPRRFSEAHNELLLTSAEAFPREFDTHVAATEPGRPVQDGVTAIVNQVISGRWASAGVTTDGSIVERLATWRPGLFPTDPHEPGAPPVPPRPGQYRIVVRAGEVLERARAWVQRPNETFDLFISQSLRDYLAGTDVDEAEHVRRAQEVHRHFGEALELARPLVAVNNANVLALHGSDVRVSYKFSDVPFSGLPLGRQLVAEMRQMNEVEPTSPDRLEKVLRADSRTTRIDFFSSYGRLSPATFSSLLSPLDKRWTACIDLESRAEFWRLRRTRRLAGCLPMGDLQRRAIIGGWYVARLTGQLRLPAEHVGQAVEVWHAERKAWLPFPQPLLVDREDIRGPGILGAVLLSSLLALARSHQYPALDPLLPYTVLRKLWDDTAGGRGEYEPVLSLAAARPLSAWLRTGATPPGGPTPESGLPASASGPEDRRAALLAKLEHLHGLVSREYLSPGQLGAVGGGTFSVLDRAEALPRVPLFHELAPDVYLILGQLIELVAKVPLDDAPETDWHVDEALG